MKYEDPLYQDRTRKQRNEWPWERHMSIGIAAICDKDGSGTGRIIACMDAKVSTDTGSAETMIKTALVTDELAAIFAGTVSHAHELLGMYRDYFSAAPLDWSKHDVLERLRVPPRLFKQQRAEAYTQSHLGISYERFLKSGQGELEPNIYLRMMNGIYNLQTRVNLIIFGFEDRTPRIFKLGYNEAGEEQVWEETQFACIRIGEETATNSLLWREQMPSRSLSESLYNVWEAKKFSELSPTIGERTLAFVVEPGFTLKSGDGRRSPGLLTAAGAEFLDRQYKRYGRRTVPADFSLPSDSFQDPH